MDPMGTRKDMMECRHDGIEYRCPRCRQCEVCTPGCDPTLPEEE